MKSMIKKSFIGLIALLPLFTACQSEPEYGDLLIPEAPENTDPKVYINEIAAPGNSATAEILQTPVEMMLPENTYSFYVHLTSPVANDVKVTIAESKEVAAAYGDGRGTFEGTIMTIANPVVTIPAGAMVSSEPVTFTFDENSADLAAFTEKSVAALVIDKVESVAPVAVGADHNAYFMLLSKRITNFKGTNDNDVVGLSKLDPNIYSAYFDGQDYASTLFDGNTSTYLFMSNGPDEIVTTFQTPQSIASIGFMYGFNYNYGPTKIEVLTSESVDGDDWVSQTGGEVETGQDYGETTVNFYSPITCKRLKLRCLECTYMYWGYNTPCVGELYFYTK